MDEDILAELDRHLTDVNLDKYWEKQVGDHTLWLTTIDYLHSNKVKEVIQGEFGLEEAKRVTLSAAIVGVNGVDLRPLRRKGKTLKVKGKDGKAELIDLPEYVYRKIANWDVEFVDVVFDVYSDIMETHKKDLVKNLVFENAKTDAEELENLEERVAALRQKLDMPPLVEAERLRPQEDARPEEAVEEEPVAPAPAEEGLEDPGDDPFPGPRTSFSGPEKDFDPFSAVPVPEPAPSPIVVPVPSEASANPSTPSAIERALLARRSSSPISQAPASAQPLVAQPSIASDEVIERPAARVVADVPLINPGAGSQSRNPRFRRHGA